MSVRRAASLLVVLAAVAPIACDLPAGDASSAERAHALLVQARAAGDVDGLWRALDPEVRAALERWVVAERRSLQVLRSGPFSDDDRAAALARLDGGSRAELADGRALFELLLGQVEPVALGFGAGLGAHPRAVTIDGSVATVVTWGGDRIEVHQASSGEWHAAPSPAAASAVLRAAAQAEANLARIRESARRLTDG